MNPPERPIAIAVVGLGKIALDQHLPAIRANPRFELVAGVSDAQYNDELPVYATITELLRTGPRVDAVAICTPPQVRAAIAHAAIDAGLHVLLEKPPAATLAELDTVRQHAAQRSVSLFAAWHSRFAPQVTAARNWLAGRTLRSGRISWREDVRKWHPRQRWLWQPGGPGVFDPGINALSILTAVCSDPVTMIDAAFDTPVNCHAPIGARLSMVLRGAAIEADFDFRQTGGEVWDIALETVDGGSLLLSNGGSRLTIDGAPAQSSPNSEYPQLYRRFAELIHAGMSDCDGEPLRLVADAFRLARTTRADAFEP